MKLEIQGQFRFRIKTVLNFNQLNGGFGKNDQI
jgi:hypothetical protein